VQHDYIIFLLVGWNFVADIKVLNCESLPTLLWKENTRDDNLKARPCNAKFTRGWIPLVRERRGQDGVNACVYLGVGGKGGAEAGGEEEQLLPLGVRRADAQHLHLFLPSPGESRAEIRGWNPERASGVAEALEMYLNSEVESSPLREVGGEADPVSFLVASIRPAARRHRTRGSFLLQKKFLPSFLEEKEKKFLSSEYDRTTNHWCSDSHYWPFVFVEFNDTTEEADAYFSRLMKSQTSSLDHEKK
jgi:hypothetical protein